MSDPLRILIIEDEPAPRADLRRLLAAQEGYAIVGEADTFGAALSRLRAGGYDLVFLDVRLIGGNGFDLVEFVAPGARVIFCTAYDSYALRAFEVNALDYLLKPVESGRLQQSLARLGKRSASSASPPLAPPPPREAGPLRETDVIHLRAEGQTSRILPISEICHIAASGNYTIVEIPGERSFLIRRPIKEWESRLPATQFVRVHRSELVNVRRVRRVRRISASSFELAVDGLSRPVRASYRYASLLRAALPELWT